MAVITFIVHSIVWQIFVGFVIRKRIVHPHFIALKAALELMKCAELVGQGLQTIRGKSRDFSPDTRLFQSRIILTGLKPRATLSLEVMSLLIQTAENSLGCRRTSN